MEYQFSRYLKAKRSVDDRALNRVVWHELIERLAALEGRPSISVLELGGGIGTMFQRMVEWGALTRAEYTIVDSQPENIDYARQYLGEWAERQGLEVQTGHRRLLLNQADQSFLIDLLAEDVFDFFRREQSVRQWDLIIAQALLDLLDVPKLLPALCRLTRPGGLLYLTVNFDGLSIFEPVSDPVVEEKILALYHRSMDERGLGGRSSGDSQTGRHLFHWLDRAGMRILAAGSSDWVVYPKYGKYPSDEAYFLEHILHFFETTLSASPAMEPDVLNSWLHERRQLIEVGKLVYIAHQMDFLVEVG